MRTRWLIVLPTVATLLVLTGMASASAGGSYRDGPLSATFSAPTNYPNCKQMWPVTVTARWNGHPAHASAFYRFLYNGRPVGSRQYPFGGTRRNPHYHVYSFYGGFYDNTFGPFGALAEGHKIVVQAVVSDGRYTAYPGTWVVVQKASGCTPY